jgi:hypothetical protein
MARHAARHREESVAIEAAPNRFAKRLRVTSMTNLLERDLPRSTLPQVILLFL